MRTRPAHALVPILMLLASAPAAADDVTLELGAGDDFVVEDSSGKAFFRVDSSSGTLELGGAASLEFPTDGVCTGGSNPGAMCVTNAECSGGGSCSILDKHSTLFSKPVSLLDRDPDGDGVDDGPGDDVAGSTRIQLSHIQTQGQGWLMTDNVLCLLFNYTNCNKSARHDPNFAGSALQLEYLFQSAEPFQQKGMEFIWEASDAGGFLDRFLMFYINTGAAGFPDGAGSFNFWPNGQDSGNATLLINGGGLEVRGRYWNKASPMTSELDQQGIARNMHLRIWDDGVADEMRTLELGHEFSLTPGEPDVDTVRVLFVGTPKNIAHAAVSNHAGVYIEDQLGMGLAGASNAIWLRPQSAVVDDDRKGNLHIEGGDAGSGHLSFGPNGALGHVYYDRAASNFAGELGSDFTGQLCLNRSDAVGPANRSAEMCDDTGAAILAQEGDGAVSGPGYFWAASDGGNFDTGSEVCRAHGLLCRANGVYDHGNAAVGSTTSITRRACATAVAAGNDFTVFCVGD